MSIEIRQPNKEELVAVRELRYRVLDKPFKIKKKTAPSEQDVEPGVIHVAAFDGGKVISYVRLNAYNISQYIVRRMATDLNYQGRGIGKRVLETAENKARNIGAKSMILFARKDTIGFYKKQGYALTGNSEVFDSYEDLEMVKDL